MLKLLKRSFALLLITASLKAQITETRFAIETTFDGKTPVSYDQNFGSLTLNSSSGELRFSTNMAKLKTGDKTIDSLLAEQDQIQLVFQGNVGQVLFGIINEENDDTYHKVLGTITVNNSTYQTVAYLKIENLSNKSDVSKSLLDLRLDIDPEVILIPYLSDYFNSHLLFQIEDGFINKMK
jgi:hypothetical protein